MSRLNIQHAEHARHHPLFTENPALWENLGGSLRLQHVQGGDRVLTYGDAATSLWLVYRGWVKLTRQTPDGKETVIGLRTEGEILGEASLFANASYPYTAEIVGADAELASVSAVSVQALISKDARLSSRIMALLNERMVQAQLKLEHMSTMSAAQRLGCFLLQLCHTQAGGAKTLQIPVEKNVLAAYLGMKPETLSRSQQQLKPLGISVDGHQISIGSIERLRDFVCESCSQSGSCAIDESD